MQQGVGKLSHPLNRKGGIKDNRNHTRAKRNKDNRQNEIINAFINKTEFDKTNTSDEQTSCYGNLQPIVFSYSVRVGFHSYAFIIYVCMCL